MSQTCGGCKHSKIPPPLMSQHRKKPLLLRVHPGECAYPAATVPMVQVHQGYRTSVWAGSDATACPCFEAREVKP